MSTPDFSVTYTALHNMDTSTLPRQPLYVFKTIKMKSKKAIAFFLLTLILPNLSLAENYVKVKYKKMTGTDFFEAKNYNMIMQRLESIKPDAERVWGNMTADQMLHHLNLAIGSGLGYYDLPDVSNFMSRGFNQLMILDVLKKFPKGSETAKPLKVVEQYDFDTEKERLKEILTKAYQTKSDNDWGRHTYFGKMSRKDWGKLIMIHCNHHFQQFSN